MMSKLRGSVEVCGDVHKTSDLQFWDKCQIPVNWIYSYTTTSTQLQKQPMVIQPELNRLHCGYISGYFYSYIGHGLDYYEGLQSMSWTLVATGSIQGVARASTGDDWTSLVSALQIARLMGSGFSNERIWKTLGATQIN